MADNVSAVPAGFTAVTPHLVVRDAARAIDFYGKAFGALEVCRMPGPGGQGVIHAEVTIHGSRLMLGDEMPMMEYWLSPHAHSGTTVALHLYVEDCDAVFERAVAAGCQVVFPCMDTFWGDRYGRVRDPFGHEWGIATHIADLTPEEIARGQEEFFRQMAEQHGGGQGGRRRRAVTGDSRILRRGGRQAAREPGRRARGRERPLSRGGEIRGGV